VKLPDPPVLLVSDRKLAVRPLPQVLAEAVAGGCRWIMLREKDLPEEELEQLLEQVLAATAGQEVSVMVNTAAALVERFSLAAGGPPAGGPVPTGGQGEARQGLSARPVGP
jgi:thiamine-phosphate pyrophosphorylase